MSGKVQTGYEVVVFFSRFLKFVYLFCVLFIKAYLYMSIHAHASVLYIAIHAILRRAVGFVENSMHCKMSLNGFVRSEVCMCVRCYIVVDSLFSFVSFAILFLACNIVTYAGVV